MFGFDVSFSQLTALGRHIPNIIKHGREVLPHAQEAWPHILGLVAIAKKSIPALQPLIQEIEDTAHDLGIELNSSRPVTVPPKKEKMIPIETLVQRFQETLTDEERGVMDRASGRTDGG